MQDEGGASHTAAIIKNFTPNGKSKYCPNIVLDDAAKMLPAFISLT